MYNELIKRLREHNGWALNETLDQAADAIEELSKPKWTSIKESMPKTTDNYLVIVRFIGAKSDVMMVDRYDARLSCFTIKAPITHWMPLPQLPKEE